MGTARCEVVVLSAAGEWRFRLFFHGLMDVPCVEVRRPQLVGHKTTLQFVHATMSM